MLWSVKGKKDKLLENYVPVPIKKIDVDTNSELTFRKHHFIQLYKLHITFRRYKEVLQAIKQLNAGGKRRSRWPPHWVIPATLGRCHESAHLHVQWRLEHWLNGKLYQGVLCFLLRKGDNWNIDNYRHLTIMNTDYKIQAKITMNRLNYVSGHIVEKRTNVKLRERH